MHIHRAGTTTAWPTVPFGGWRLWDAGVTWPELEPKEGVWRWEVLDRLLSLADSHGASILLDLGMTPGWAASRPTEKSVYGVGAASVPASMMQWQEYVTTVMTHCRGRVHEYELWNEPNFTTFYTGTSEQLVELARVGYMAIKKIDGSAVVTSPGFSLEDDGGFRWLEQFLAAGGGKYADVISVHLYVGTGRPEDHLRQLARVRELLARYHLQDKPIWNTEMGWPRKKVFASREEAAGYVARTYLLDWALGVQRVYWYAWDNTEWVSLVMVENDQKTPTAAARAYSVIEDWMVGSAMQSCIRTAEGLWVCELTRDGKASRILWSEDQSVDFQLPDAWRIQMVEDLTGTKHPVSGATIKIGSSPVRVS